MDERCEICDARAATQKCIQCGKNVCATCFWTQMGICKACGDSGTGAIR
ncbi:MAG: hypothetical protein JSV56_06500 [Methanomassiliicoccales archaeon]|nr:MAG: hypothetical protein JSV56_06500 [Methanomassiliicoccales archaeon]